VSLQSLIAEVRALRTTCDNHYRMINDFLSSNRSNIDMIRTELRGSGRGHDTAMLNSLKQVEESLKKAMQQLSQARDALDRVQNI